MDQISERHTIQLITPRLIMRDFEEDDDHLIFKLDSDPEVHRFLGNNPLKDAAQARDVISMIRSQYAERGIARWAVIEKESQQFIGWAGFKLNVEEINGHNQFYDLGYRFQKKYWGQGYASESAKHLLDWGLHNLNPENIYAMTHKENEASRRVLIKTGFIERGLFEHDDMEVSWYDLKK
jgi:[ribosomal protein S5]-alanine N-acetyltransferase